MTNVKMKFMAPLAVLTATCAFGVPALAQTPATGPRTYVNASVGVQALGPTTDAKNTSLLFDEVARFEGDHKAGTGLLVDIAAGRRVRHNLIVGVAFSASSSEGNATGLASIPDPLFVGRPRAVAFDEDGLKRSERALHAHLVWFRALKENVDLALSVGPSLINVSQEFVSAEVPSIGQSVTFVPDEQSGTGFGFNAGADMTYLVTPKYGLGVLLRYTWATVGLHGGDVTAGGLQAGVGLRVRF